MTCEPYNPQVGLFINTLTFGSKPTSGTWSFRFNRVQGSSDIYQLRESETVRDELFVPQGGSVRWIFFENNKFLVVRHAATFGASVTYRIFIYDLRSGANRYELGHGPYTAMGGTPQLLFHPSHDGTAFFVYIGGDGLLNTSHTHKIIRTDNGQLLCSHGPIGPVDAQRLAEVTAARTVRIMTSPGPGGPTAHSECPLPHGELRVNPNSQTFPEAVVGGPPALASTTWQFTLENVGSDCLQVESIGDIPPFFVTSTSKPLPADLGPSDTLAVEITFSPTSVGSFGPTNLPITCTPAEGDNALICEGVARNPITRIGFSATSLNFGKHPVGETSSLTLTIRNDGETSLNVSVDSPPSGSPFQWGVVNESISYGGSRPVQITFTPVIEGGVTETMSVVSNDPGSPNSIILQGEGCIANAEIVDPEIAIIDFGQVQRGFRTVRYITIENTGDGPLTFKARIDGADASLYGLQPPSGSVTDVLAIRNYTVNPKSACGTLPTGTGETIVAVAFFAHNTPRITNAQLIIENHNATNTTTTSWTFPLTAEIVPLKTVDAALVLDRSGSMSQKTGLDTKSQAAIDAGQLFVQLMRPDIEDRLTVVKYNETPDIIQLIIEIISTNQTTIVNKINSIELAPTGFTSIAAGVMVGLDQLAVTRVTVPPELEKAMVVLTDGKDNRAYLNPSNGRWYSILGGEVEKPSGGKVMTEPLPTPADVKIYSVGLGKEEDIDKGRLNQLSMATGAYFGIVGDLTGKNYFDLQKYYTQLYMDIVGTSGVKDPFYTIAPGQEHRIEFNVLRGDVNALVVIFDHKGRHLPFYLVSPEGELIEPGIVPPGYQLRSGATNTARFVEFRMPQKEPDRYAGRWTVVVTHHGEVCFGIPGENQHIDLLTASEIETEDLPHWKRGFVSFKCEKYTEPVDYSIAVGVGSNFRMQPYTTPGIVHIGDPILLTAVITEAGLPVNGCTVTVKVISPSGNEWNLILKDDGAHDDGDPNNGEYARKFTQTFEGGTYLFTFRATGKSRDGEPVTREAVRAKYVEGDIPIKPDPGKPGSDVKNCCQRLIRLLQIIVILLIIFFIVFLIMMSRKWFAGLTFSCLYKVLSFFALPFLSMFLSSES
jgi:hypothetical protein